MSLYEYLCNELFIYLWINHSSETLSDSWMLPALTLVERGVDGRQLPCLKFKAGVARRFGRAHLSPFGTDAPHESPGVNFLALLTTGFSVNRTCGYSAETVSSRLTKRTQTSGPEVGENSDLTTEISTHAHALVSQLSHTV